MELAPLYDLRLYVESDATSVLDTAMKRGAGRWEREWRELFLPSADLYFAINPHQRADFIVAGRGAGP